MKLEKQDRIRLKNNMEENHKNEVIGEIWEMRK